ncbi:hypothetical protein [Microbulbifer sp. JSM ZJ756]|uniref:hypothetical protein n=1 Tax=Microbulbifer sp. JSM ZJ756 TaxID=3376191 RepID=UPI003796C13E
MFRTQKFHAAIDEAFELLSRFQEPLPEKERRALGAILARHKDAMEHISTPAADKKAVNRKAKSAHKALARFEEAWSGLTAVFIADAPPDYSVDVSPETFRVTRESSDPAVAAYTHLHDLNGEALWGYQISDCLKQLVDEQLRIQTATCLLPWSQRVDNILSMAASECESRGIIISAQPESRFFKIADWLLPPNAGTRSRIQKLITTS